MSHFDAREPAGTHSVDVLHARTKLFNECHEFTTTISGSRGLMSLRPEEVKKISRDALDQLEAKPEQVVTEMQQTVAAGPRHCTQNKEHQNRMTSTA